MKSQNWRKTAPALILVIGTLAAFLLRGREEPELVLNLTMFVVLPILLLGAFGYWLLEGRSRAQSSQTWKVMEQHHPDEVKYLFRVHPETRTNLESLGLATRPAILTFPVIGVVFGKEVTFWEQGKAAWSLRIAYSDIESVEIVTMDNGTRSWPAIHLSLIHRDDATEREGPAHAAPQRGGLVLRPQHRGHRNLSPTERTELVQELNSRLNSNRLA